MREKKRISLRQGMAENKKEHIILTNCPSCISGLGRNSDMGIQPRHLAEMLAISLGGDNWQKELKELACNGERVTF
jgi:Fe-S oxidoreductase